MEITRTAMRVKLGSAEQGNLLLIHLTTTAAGVPNHVEKITSSQSGEGMLRPEELERVGRALTKIREKAEGYAGSRCCCLDHGYYERGDTYRCPQCDAENEREKEEKANGVHPILTAPEISDEGAGNVGF